MIVRLANLSDAQRVFDVRNHPSSLRNFHDTNPVTWEQHEAWFERTYFNNGRNACCVIEDDGLVVGYCRFDRRDDGSFVISIAIDPDRRGRGAGSSLLSEALASFADGKTIRAEILKGNDASLNLFIRHGFTVVEEDEKEYRLVHQPKTP